MPMKTLPQYSNQNIPRVQTGSEIISRKNVRPDINKRKNSSTLPQYLNRSVPKVFDCSLKKKRKRKKSNEMGEKKLELIKEKKTLTHKTPNSMFEFKCS